jgi:hypothetical protein
MELAKLIIEWGGTPTLARCGGVDVGSTLPSHGHKGYGGLGNFWVPKQGNVPRGTFVKL